MPAQEMHTVMAQKHILVQAAMLQQGTLAVVRSSMSGLVRRRSIFVFPLARERSMTRLIRVLANPRASIARNITFTKVLSMPGLVRCLDIMNSRWLGNLNTGNGGEGGDGRSGDAYAVLYGATPHSGSGYERAVKRDGHDREHSGAEAHSGPGGNASGGNVKGDGGLINILSGNGGDGGDASSGSAFAYGKDAKAYSGPGGNASGGSVNHEMERKPGYGYGRRSNGIIDVASSVYS
ncbi:hypothetical protein F5148DRAFT_1161632 [Russula earlei]|uniref:Uncharacterized protein n=1 Tax=Russula earlei TaxID=71964 RepID=A0ACC0UNH3_9AGAM|nr:hypothetical protein F5148DRAFT_1161632 [Russula earlei]